MSIVETTVEAPARDPDRASVAPDWSAPDAPQLVCPLCDYNLRGLTQPRCPECGYQFTWRGLIEQRGLEHPYLFEHHRRRPVGSFVHPLLAAALPLRFWRTLRPGHEPNLRRLVVYWIVVALPGALLMTGLPLAAHVVGQVVTQNWYRNMILNSPQSYLGQAQYQQVIKSYGSVQNY